jgi:hypothetical protein
MKLTLEEKQIRAKCEFRASLWKEFVANQVVLATAPETFSGYCERFRERWVAAQ